MALPILYSFRRCPYAIRARMALHAAAVAVEIREVALRSKPATLLALSPKATVPVLQLQDGTVLDESLDIMFWALRQSDPQRWLALPHCNDGRTWAHRNDSVFKPLLDHYKYALRFPALSQQAHRDRALAAFVSPLEARLADRGFVGGTAAGWADVAVFPFVRQFAMVEPGWFATADLPALRRWLGFWTDSACFAAVMAKAAPWQEPARMADEP